MVLLGAVAVTLGTAAGGAGALFCVAAYAEFVSLCFVDTERPGCSFVALGTGIKSHMLGVIEIDITVVSLEYFGVGERGEHDREECYGYELFHY